MIEGLVLWHRWVAPDVLKPTTWEELAGWRREVCARLTVCGGTLLGGVGAEVVARFDSDELIDLIELGLDLLLTATAREIPIALGVAGGQLHLFDGRAFGQPMGEAAEILRDIEPGHLVVGPSVLDEVKAEFPVEQLTETSAAARVTGPSHQPSPASSWPVQSRSTQSRVVVPSPFGDDDRAEDEEEPSLTSELLRAFGDDDYEGVELRLQRALLRGGAKERVEHLRVYALQRQGRLSEAWAALVPLLRSTSSARTPLLESLMHLRANDPLRATRTALCGLAQSLDEGDAPGQEMLRWVLNLAFERCGLPKVNRSPAPQP